jgi:exopolysaccharide biosynthesis predicted pyruvyltransferase EpsI
MVGLRYECLQDIQKEITNAYKPFLGGRELIGYADPAINHNLGDQLLWAGSNKLFQRFGKKAILHCGGSQSKDLVESCLDQKDAVVQALSGKGVLWFNPGGNWGDLYRHVHNQRLEVWKMASDNNIPFISGPQSIWYHPEKTKGAQRDDEIIQGSITITPI